MKYKNSIFFVLVAAALVSAAIDLNNLGNYANQTTPNYITRDNTPPDNEMTDYGATLGRVLFYDKSLSANNTIACASCHKQAFAFGDTVRLSTGLNGGFTGRHAMRLANARFGNEVKFFWDERATSLEDQTTHPIQDFTEMGFSGTGGQPGFDSLVNKLESIGYYDTLFTLAFGSSLINEDRVQRALAQFVRSIQSFDSKFDVGLATTNNLGAPFPNFTPQENQGKNLFVAPPPAGGAGCQGCHAAPEFDIDPNSLNNGVIATAANPAILDLTNTRAPSLRNLFNPAGALNGPLMHNGDFVTIQAVINHYNLIPPNPANTNLDPRLAGPGGNLQLTQNEKNALEAFLRTLTGTDVYTNPKWSDPFNADGTLDLQVCSFATTISGNQSVCDGTVQTYSVAAGPAGATYDWTVTGGTILSSPPFTNSIQVQWNSNQGGTVTVIQINP
ncbi:cytochrome-c peroxidase [Sphingobacteriales bacterium UPWRP_1]|nr:cytochrome-c peroxidase [Sphingobacteriales bacterium TSM_CSS]PSJ76309.1 cytochrome-c peroxidase [Sphingobacteriales bacterium UPWRP_1]